MNYSHVQYNAATSFQMLLANKTILACILNNRSLLIIFSYD